MSVIGFLIRASFRLIGLAVVLYLAFFVPLGQRTLYEHLVRIARTPEAQELGSEVDGVVESATRHARERVMEPVSDLSEGESLAQPREMRSN